MTNILGKKYICTIVQNLKLKQLISLVTHKILSMRLKLLFFFVSFLSVQSKTFAQSIYQLKYNYHSSRDTTTYNAFFIPYEDGSGFMRTVYQTPEDKKDMLVEMDLDQEIILDKNDKPNPKKIYITSINPNIIQTDFAQHPDTPVFLFTYNNKTKFMEPSKLVSIDPNGKKYIDPKSTLIVQQLDRKRLHKPIYLITSALSIAFLYTSIKCKPEVFYHQQKI